ncbi:hypothetical protein [Actinophytocola sp.]|uniref:hypothetical protein n=1 Tax=Actinophytocola sp. TaxID=1872138 RepID=UPI002D80A727|nr:hypothetical protein [Actinophytocola sp.]HET9143618.1 hypothetical protein [Actinophytocola sp.]
MLEVRNGHRSIVLPCLDSDRATPAYPPRSVAPDPDQPGAADPVPATETVENLLRAAVRRAGGDLADYEMAVHIPGQTEPVTTVAVAA